MSTRRSPEPWSVWESENWGVVVQDSKDCVLARMADHGVFTRPNARLIAAAPDLLAALEGVLAVADRNTKEFDAARAAIARARA